MTRRCKGPGCEKRVRRPSQLYHSNGCRQKAHRARQSAERRRLEAEHAESERSRIEALESARAQAFAERHRQLIRSAASARGHFRRELRDSFRRQLAAIRTADTIEDLQCIGPHYEAERAPWFEAASGLPWQRTPSVERAAQQMAKEKAQAAFASAVRKRQRRQQTKRRKSPLEIGTAGVTGAEEKDRGRIIVKRGE